MIDNLSFRILQHCRDDFKPIKMLTDKSMSRSALYRRKDILCKKGLLQTDGKDRYRTTEEGLKQLQSILGEVPEGLASVYPPLTQVPTPYHTAAIELAIAAIIARKHELRPDRHPSIVVAGPTLKWKTSAAIFLCHILGLDPSIHIVNLAAEYGKSLWLRKISTGEISYKRDLLEAPLVVFDELQNADPECKRLLKIWMDGRMVLPLENEKLTLQATSFITINPRVGKTLEERIGLERAQIRRCIICDLTHIKIPNLAIKGEEIIKAAKTHPPLVLPRPRHDCASYKAQTYELLSHTLNETGLELVDLETLIMLSTAMTAFMEPLEAIRRVLYDSHLLYQTLGWTMAEWQLHVKSFPQMVPENIATEISSLNRRTISDQTLADTFRHLDSGGSTTELVTKLGLTFEDADRIARKHAELKSLDSKIHMRKDGAEKEDKVVQKLEREVRIAELKRKKAELLRPLEMEKKAEEGNLEIKKNTEMIHMILEQLSGSEVSFLIHTLSFNMDSEGASNDATLALADIEIDFYGKLLALDRDYAWKLLKKNEPWKTWIPGLNDKAVDKNREKWIEFLKQHAPEFLAEAINYYKIYE